MIQLMVLGGIIVVFKSISKRRGIHKAGTITILEGNTSCLIVVHIKGVNACGSIKLLVAVQATKPVVGIGIGKGGVAKLRQQAAGDIANHFPNHSLFVVGVISAQDWGLHARPLFLRIHR